MLKDTEECGGRSAEVSDGIFPSITPPLLSACVNKASLKYLIILCKLQDQGTYERLPKSVCAYVCGSRSRH